MVFGGDEEDRTPDLRIANATLSQLSYVPRMGAILANSEFFLGVNPESPSLAAPRLRIRRCVRQSPFFDTRRPGHGMIHGMLRIHNVQHGDALRA